ncbi:MAG: hypothetical protein AB4426_09900 [Xenococcaceae cyanobacterium]
MDTIKVNCEDKATVRPASTLEAGRNRQQATGNFICLSWNSFFHVYWDI